jgi:hypothetical protein
MARCEPATEGLDITIHGKVVTQERERAIALANH